MFTNRKNLVAVAVLLLAILPMAGTASADVLDDISGWVQDARDYAKQARDRAKEAKDRATEARDKAEEVRATIETAVSTLSDSMRDAIAEAAEDIKGMLDEEMQGRQAFLNGAQPEAFRRDLVSFLEQGEDLLTHLAAAYPGAGAEVSFAKEIEIVENLPARGLWPLHRALSTVDFLNSGLIDQLKDANAGLELVVPLLGEDDGAGGSVSSRGAGALNFELERQDAMFIYENVQRVSEATTAIKRTALALKGIGTILQMIGQRGVFDDLKVQIHGYVGKAIKNNGKMKLGIFCSGVGDALGEVASSVTAKTRHAMIIGAIAELRDNDETILANQEAILANQETILANHASIMESLADMPGSRGRGRGR